jgi:hypothetical protein
LTPTVTTTDVVTNLRQVTSHWLKCFKILPEFLSQENDGYLLVLKKITLGCIFAAKIW